MMFTFGAIMFILSGLVVFGSDRLYKNGKIQNIKTLLIVKSSGLLASIGGAFLMFYGK